MFDVRLSKQPLISGCLNPQNATPLPGVRGCLERQSNILDACGCVDVSLSKQPRLSQAFRRADGLGHVGAALDVWRVRALLDDTKDRTVSYERGTPVLDDGKDDACCDQTSRLDGVPE